MKLSDLNGQQLNAVTLIGGPILIFAGAGSGKTRVLTHKIAYLVEEVGLLAENILAVTFTNKAANEMKQRVQELLNMDISSMSVGTFHSISAQILRREIQLLGYSNDFTIYDQDDSCSLLKKIIRDMDLDEKTFVSKSIQTQISNAKNKMISSEIMLNSSEGFMDEKLAVIYQKYQELLKKNNALDFDDLLLKPLEIFMSYPNRLEFYQNKYKYVLVDEYQDTNRPQFEFVKALSEKHRDICVVGDDDQSIYSWRGADINNILNFSEIFNESKIIKLEQNYRSTKTILECAWSVVSKNIERAEKKLWTDNNQGEKIKILECNDERDEGWKLLNIIKDETVKGEHSFNDLVILYRTNAQSRVVEDALRREGVPYEIIGGVKFYARKEVKDILAYLRLIVNPNDSVSFDRVINFPPRGIGKTSLEKIHSYADDKKCSYLDALSEIDSLKIGQKQKISLHEFYKLINKFRTLYLEQSAASIANDLLLDIDLHSYYQNQNTQESLERWNNVQELLNSINEFQDNQNENNLSNFLEEVSLLTDIDRWNTSSSVVTLMTIHSSKGLEFPIVMIVGLEEGLFPLGSQSFDIAEIQEERRLFYVAVTRAQKKVYLSCANARRRFGGPPIPAVKSRFINELPETLIEQNNLERRYDIKESSINNIKQSKFNTDSNIVYCIGDLVMHKIFGKGKVVAIDGNGRNAKLTIVFSGNVRKKIIARFANLQQIS